MASTPMNQALCRLSPLRGGRNEAGFTLIELAVVVSLLGLVAALAAPNFRALIGTMNTKSAAFDLINDLTIARSEALKRNTTISINPVSNSWANGWSVQAGGDILRQHPELSSGLSIGGAPVGGVVFEPNGRLRDTNVSSGNLSWSISSSTSGATGRCVIISPTGSARSKSGGCS